MTKDKETTVKTVQLYGDIAARAKVVAKREGKDFKEWVNELILLTMEKNELLSRMMPTLSLVDKSPTSLVIYDSKQNRTAEIVLKDGQLQCYLCEKNDCPHIEFAKMLPELGHLNLARKK